jgi:hypothetical protein
MRIHRSASSPNRGYRTELSVVHLPHPRYLRSGTLDLVRGATHLSSGLLNRGLAYLGLLLAAAPLLAPIVLSLSRLLAGYPLRFDVLMAAELFPIHLLGVALLLVSAARSRRPWQPLAATLTITLGTLLALQATGGVPGLASGMPSTKGWPDLVALLLIVGSLGAMATSVVLGFRLTEALQRGPSST